MTRTVRAALAAGALAIALPCSAAAQTPVATVSSQVDQQSSTVGFTVSAKLLITLKKEGRFREFTGTVSYDPARPADTKVDLTVYTASVDMGDAEQDALLRSDGFFETANFPTMHFVSTEVTPGTGGALAVTGDLTIRDVTKRVTIPVRLVPGGADAPPRFEMQFQIDRTEFGLNGSPKGRAMRVSIGKKVQIHMAIATAMPRLPRR